jgi:DNA-binding PadR family transcriptional regulator
MRDPAELRLSLTEWLVLSVAAEKPTHGFAMAAQLGRGTVLGGVWHVPRPQVYRSLGRLAGLGLIRETGRSLAGPARPPWPGCPVGTAGEAGPAGPGRG